MSYIKVFSMSGVASCKAPGRDLVQSSSSSSGPVFGLVEHSLHAARMAQERFCTQPMAQWLRIETLFGQVGENMGGE